MLAVAIAVCALASAVGDPAYAGFPGANGRIVYASQRADQRYEIRTMNPDGTGLRSLAIGENPKYSRAGTRIAFIRASDLFVMNVDGTGARQLTKGPAVDYNPSWSPDDKRIAFARRSGGTFDIYVAAVDGGAPKNLTRSPTIDDRGPTWSPDGTRIAYESEGQIRVMRIDGKTAKALTASGTNVSPAWSPDGSRMAFAAKLDDGNWEISVMRVDGSSVRRLAEHPAIDLDPVWSPDGRSIAFTSTRSTNYDIHVMAADGSNVTQLTAGSTADTTADWQSVDRGPIGSGVLRIRVGNACNERVGTGFVVAPRLVMTAGHVVTERGRAASRIVLMAGGKELATAKVVGQDRLSDLALLRTSKRLSGHVFRFAVRAPRKGDDVEVLGYPQGAASVVRRGRVESPGQTTVGEDDNIRRRGLVQVAVDAAEGMSGSPLVQGPEDVNGGAGHVFGVVIQIPERGSIAWAVPARIVEAKLGQWRSARPIPTMSC